jgi:hypothetical protein
VQHLHTEECYVLRDTQFYSRSTLVHPFWANCSLLACRIGQTKKVTIIKLVAKDTVDEDIYAMQQRKAKMNAAIMGSDAEWNKQTKGDKKQMLETAVNRFLKSPNAHTKAGTGGTDTSRLLPAEPTIPTKSDPEIDTVQKADSECL